jgi:hypothetical protein
MRREIAGVVQQITLEAEKTLELPNYDEVEEYDEDENN